LEREKIVQGTENNQEKVSEVQKIADVPDKIVEKIVASENSVTPDKIVEKISKEKTQIDTTELLNIDNQHSEIQAEIENFKKKNYGKLPSKVRKRKIAKCRHFRVVWKISRNWRSRFGENYFGNCS